VLTVRDSPAAWYRSTRDSIWRVFAIRQTFPYNVLIRLHPGLVRNVKFLEDTIWNGLFQGRFAHDEQYAQQVYIDWINEVRSVVPAGQLLVFNVKEGWEPLCRFLNVPVPKDQPFPRSNASEGFVEAWKRRFLTRYLQYVSLIAGGALAALFIGRKLLQR
jgi:hypothetical protein